MPSNSAQDNLRHRPIIAKLFLVFSSPFRPDFFGKLRRLFELSAREIQEKRRFNYRHFQRQKLIMVGDQHGDMKSADGRHAFFCEPVVNVALTPIRLLPVVNFKRGSTGIGIAFQNEDVTMYAEAKLTGEMPAPRGRVNFSLLDRSCLLQPRRAFR
jgi:hypothetical protein